MKSSTRNLVNPQVIGADKRLQAVVKKQEAEHKHLLDGHNKEMQELRDQLKLAMERFEALSQKNDRELKDFREQTASHISMLRERLGAQERVFSDQKKTIEDLHEQLLSFQALYSSMRDVDNLKKEMEKQMREATVSHLVSLQDIQRELKSIVASLKEELSQFKESADKRITELSTHMDARFCIDRLDRAGVINQIKIREKDIVVIEKKIENIYTLIERINKRGSS